MSKIMFDMLELPTEEEVHRQDYEDEPHPLKDEDWVWEVEYLMDEIEEASRRLRREMGNLTHYTPVLQKFKYLKSLIRKYGNHASDCGYYKVRTPRAGDEYRLCDCGWLELERKLKRKRWY